MCPSASRCQRNRVNPTDGTTVAASASPAGALAIVASAGNAGRDYGIGKQIETCDLAHETCAPIPNSTIWYGTGESTLAQASGAASSLYDRDVLATTDLVQRLGEAEGAYVAANASPQSVAMTCL